MNLKRDILWRVRLIYLLIMLGAIAIIGQSLRLQIFHGKSLRAEAQSLNRKYETIKAERGSVYSEDGNLLATSLPFFELRFDTRADGLSTDAFFQNVDSLSILMHQKFGKKTPLEYKQWLVNHRERGNRFLLVAKKLQYPDLLEIQEWPIFRRGRFKGGLIVYSNNKRVNPFNILAHRTIGYVRKNSQSVGLEAWFNKHLAGVDGQRMVEKISGSTWVPVNDKEEIEPENGRDLVTTLDVRIQDIVHTALERGLQNHGADHGCAIVMEVRTGKIKAIANLKHTGEGSYWERYNFAIGEATEPGSTFKLASLLALLDDKKVHLGDSVDLKNGKVKFFDRLMKDSEWHPHRRVTVQKAFELSSNVGISVLVNRHYRKSPKSFFKQLKNFGLLEPTGITVKGEPKPIFTKPGDQGWSGVALPWLSIGYGTQLTPLQTLSFYNAVANDGKLMRPYLVKSVSNYGKAVERFEPEVLKKSIASQEAIDAVKQCLVGAVENGTAKNIAISTLQLAGKTGTAKISDPQRGYQNVYQASFAGYFPADAPVYSCIVVVNSPRRGQYYGSLVAAPIFKEISEKLYSNLMEVVQSPERDSTLQGTNFYFQGVHGNDLESISQTFGFEFNTSSDGDWFSGPSNALNGYKFSSEKLPNLKGMGLKDALYLLENLGYKVEFSGSGKVVNQSILPGTEVVPGSYIKIQLSV